MERGINTIYFDVEDLYEKAKIEETGDSLMFFAPYYMNKYFIAIDYFKRYEVGGDLTVLAHKIVQKYCMTGNYSLKDEYNEAFLDFLNEEYDKMRIVANALDESKLKGRH